MTIKKLLTAFTMKSILRLAYILITMLDITSDARKITICHVRKTENGKKFHTWHIKKSKWKKTNHKNDLKGHCNKHCDELCGKFAGNKCVSVQPKCEATQCRYVTKDCDDKVACTVDSCDKGTGACSNVVDHSKCNDNNACTIDTCAPTQGGCKHENINCDDQNACTIDLCDPITGCKHENINCDDGDPCTIDSCDPVKGCSHTPKKCEDKNECTLGTCNPSTGECSYLEPNDGLCAAQEECNPDHGCRPLCITGTEEQVNAYCAKYGDCCDGGTLVDSDDYYYPAYSCSSWGDGTVTVCKGACNGYMACDGISGATVGINSCVGFVVCGGAWGTTVGDGSCRGTYSCTSMASKTIGSNSCVSESSESLYACKYCTLFPIGDDVATCTS